MRPDRSRSRAWSTPDRRSTWRDEYIDEQRVTVERVKLEQATTEFLARLAAESQRTVDNSEDGT